VETNRSLSDLTSMHTGGVARYFCAPEDPDGLGAVMGRCLDDGMEMRFLGGATNVIVVSDVVDAMVVRIHSPAMASLEFEGDTVTAGAGLRMERLVSECAGRGLGGLEFMAGVPGTVGGAVASRASTRGGSFPDVVAGLETVGAGAGPEWTEGAALPGGRAVTRCSLHLEPGDPAEIQARLRDEKDYRRSTQPYGVKSAGCVFRNPPGDSAGRLIDEAGLKGTRVGGAEVSEMHANYIVNSGSAKGSDVAELIELMRKSVMDSAGVELELEVELW
jgi:UDP-N-acetylmuramate dehydrogenase